MQKHQTACVKRLVFVSTFLLAICFPVLSQERLEVGKGPVVATPEMVEEGKRRRELLSNPYFFKLHLVWAWIELDESERLAKIPYKVGDRIAFHLIVSHDLTEPIDIKKTDIYDQTRPQLFWDGQLVPYKKRVTELVELKDKEYEVFSSKPMRLVGGKSHRMEVIDVADWYRKLEPGHYMLSVRRRFVWGGGWAESDSVTFEVLPK